MDNLLLELHLLHIDLYFKQLVVAKNSAHHRFRKELDADVDIFVVVKKA